MSDMVSILSWRLRAIGFQLSPYTLLAQPSERSRRRYLKRSSKARRALLGLADSPVAAVPV
jgi:hypothetical protein